MKKRTAASQKKSPNLPARRKRSTRKMPALICGIVALVVIPRHPLGRGHGLFGCSMPCNQNGNLFQPKHPFGKARTLTTRGPYLAVVIILHLESTHFASEKGFRLESALLCANFLTHSRAAKFCRCLPMKLVCCFYGNYDGQFWGPDSVFGRTWR
jgi:hypothetical protein